MDNKKIGIFIADLRKEKGLTQKQLAESLNVTDKAVSRWETGKGLPEASLFIPLADAFGITVNELLSGEKIPPMQFANASDENLVSVYKNTEKMKKRYTVIGILLIIVGSLSIIFAAKSINASKNYSSYSVQLTATDKASVIETLQNVNEDFHYYDKDTVCTSYNIQFDRLQKLKYAEFLLFNRIDRQYVTVTIAGKMLLVSIQREHTSDADGVMFHNLCDFAANTDFAKISEDCHLKDLPYDEIHISGDSESFENFDKKSPRAFTDNAYTFDGETKRILTSDGMDGKYFHAAVFNIDTSAGEHVVYENECIVYIPR